MVTKADPGLAHLSAPQNCVLSLSDFSQIYVIDFGLTKSFRDSSGKHVHYAESKVGGASSGQTPQMCDVCVEFIVGVSFVFLLSEQPSSYSLYYAITLHNNQCM